MPASADDLTSEPTYIDSPRSRADALASARRIPVHHDGSALLARRSELDRSCAATGAVGRRNAGIGGDEPRLIRSTPTPFRTPAQAVEVLSVLPIVAASPLQGVDLSVDPRRKAPPRRAALLALYLG
jgi:hypothetical protein